MAFSPVVGPQDWARQYEQCNGIRQSPVHVHSDSVIHNPELGQFFFGGHEDIHRLKARMINSGKAVQVELSGTQYIEDGGLNGRYIAIQFHFHWGSESSRGSEHVLNMRRFPMELHIVHYAQKYGNLSTAIGKSDGLAVLSFLFETTEEENLEFDSLASHLTNISEPGQSVEVDEFCLKTIFPGDLRKFYRYLGSLTTPPCQESVIWTIFSDTVKISKRQMNMFRHLRSAPLSVVSAPSAQEAGQAEFVKDIFLGDNFRPLQELNGREIYSSVDPKLMKLKRPGRFERPAFGSSHQAGPNMFYNTMSTLTAIVLLPLLRL
ncbi:carbonic anhydrase 14-like [Liolophura sinensis]|uniref:carbonic anhydrase 14-like n=1 Tax=Liolophura sinensis TaxID=3198878 RepID=UPI0031591CB0